MRASRSPATVSATAREALGPSRCDPACSRQPSVVRALGLTVGDRRGKRGGRPSGRAGEPILVRTR